MYSTSIHVTSSQSAVIAVVELQRGTGGSLGRFWDAPTAAVTSVQAKVPSSPRSHGLKCQEMGGFLGWEELKAVWFGLGTEVREMHMPTPRFPPLESGSASRGVFMPVNET